MYDGVGRVGVVGAGCGVVAIDIRHLPAGVVSVDVDVGVVKYMNVYIVHVICSVTGVVLVGFVCMSVLLLSMLVLLLVWSLVVLLSPASLLVVLTPTVVCVMMSPILVMVLSVVVLIVLLIVCFVIVGVGWCWLC